jgi:uncharacterized membrane protein
MKTTHAAMTAITGLLALGAALSTPALADEKPGMEKCFGVAKAGKNDCAGPAHACAGQSKTDAGGKDWIYVPKGTCERLVGGSATAK